MAEQAPKGRMAPVVWVAVATGALPALTVEAGGMASTLGVDPRVHCSIAPDVTSVGMVSLS
jgi:hypothetical protein